MDHWLRRIVTDTEQLNGCAAAITWPAQDLSRGTLQCVRRYHVPTPPGRQRAENHLVNGFRLEVNAAVATQKMAAARMIAGKGVVQSARVKTVARDGSGAVDSQSGAEQIEVDPLMSSIRAGFATRKFPDHQSVAGPIEYIPNFDREDV